MVCIYKLFLAAVLVHCPPLGHPLLPSDTCPTLSLPTGAVHLRHDQGETAAYIALLLEPAELAEPRAVAVQ